jgi:hypothetical protein
VADAPSSISAVASTSEHDYAVVVGISSYPGLTNLPGAADDARAFAGWLTGPGRLPPWNVALLVGDAPGSANALPTRSDIDNAFAPLVQRTANEDMPRIRRLYIFVSGPRIQDQRRHGRLPPRRRKQAAARTGARHSRLRQRLPSIWTLRRSGAVR